MVISGAWGQTPPAARSDPTGCLVFDPAKLLDPAKPLSAEHRCLESNLDSGPVTSKASLNFWFSMPGAMTETKEPAASHFAAGSLSPNGASGGNGGSECRLEVHAGQLDEVDPVRVRDLDEGLIVAEHDTRVAVTSAMDRDDPVDPRPQAERSPQNLGRVEVPEQVSALLEQVAEVLIKLLGVADLDEDGLVASLKVTGLPKGDSHEWHSVKLNTLGFKVLRRKTPAHRLIINGGVGVRPSF